MALRMVTCPKILAAPFFVFFPQTNRGKSGTTHTYQRGKCRQDIHDRESNGHTRDGKRSNSVSNENTVHDMIKGNNDHADNGRKRIFEKQFFDIVLSQRMWIAVYVFSKNFSHAVFFFLIALILQIEQPLQRGTSFFTKKNR